MSMNGWNRPIRNSRAVTAAHHSFFEWRPAEYLISHRGDGRPYSRTNGTYDVHGGPPALHARRTPRPWKETTRATANPRRSDRTPRQACGDARACACGLRRLTHAEKTRRRQRAGRRMAERRCGADRCYHYASGRESRRAAATHRCRADGLSAAGASSTAGAPSNADAPRERIATCATHRHGTAPSPTPAMQAARSTCSTRG